MSAWLGKILAAPNEEMLSFSLGDSALRRIRLLVVSTWFSKIVALRTEEVLSFGLCGLALGRIGRLDVLACICMAMAPSTKEVLSFGLVGNFFLTCTWLEGEHCSTFPLISQ